MAKSLMDVLAKFEPYLVELYLVEMLSVLFWGWSSVRIPIDRLRWRLAMYVGFK